MSNTDNIVLDHIVELFLPTQCGVCREPLPEDILKNATKDAYMFLLGVMNSSLLWYFIRSTSNPYNNSYYYFKTKYLEPFSLPLVDKDKQARIAKLAEKVHEAQNASRPGDTTALEQEIDHHVYALYSLTPEEIKIVEGAAQ